MSDYIINKPDDFELNETLECGQCFHFNKLDENDNVYILPGALPAHPGLL